MNSVRRRIGTGMVLGGLVALSVGLVAGPSYAVVPNTNDCLSHLSSPQQGSLTITSTAGPTVPAGESVRVDATWHTPEWTETDKILVCPTTDGIFDSRMAGGQRPMTNDGSFSWTFTVPADMPVGSEICVKDVLMGQSTVNTPTQVSNTICFRSAAALPTTTTAPPTTTTTAATTVTTNDSSGDLGPSGTGTGGDVVLSQTATDPAPLVELPRTGAGNGSLALAGVLAVLVGGALVALGRRRTAGSKA